MIVSVRAIMNLVSVLFIGLQFSRQEKSWFLFGHTLYIYIRKEFLSVLLPWVTASDLSTYWHWFLLGFRRRSKRGGREKKSYLVSWANYNQLCYNVHFQTWNYSNENTVLGNNRNVTPISNLCMFNFLPKNLRISCPELTQLCRLIQAV